MDALHYQRERAFGLLRYVCRYKLEYFTALAMWNLFEQELMDHIRNGSVEDLIASCDKIADTILGFLTSEMEKENEYTNRTYGTD